MPDTTVFFQDKCLLHRYVRSEDRSLIFERPERLRAVKAGVAAAIARLELQGTPHPKGKRSSSPDSGLTAALERLNIEEEAKYTQDQVAVIMSTASVEVLNNAAVKYVHGDIDGDVYLEKLVQLAEESEEKIGRGACEIPEGLSQGDLYREC